MCEYNLISTDMSKIIVQIIKEKEDFIRKSKQELEAQMQLFKQGEN